MNPLFNQKQNLNPMSMISKFNEFKQMMAGKDINKIYNDTINSGKYTKEQIEQAKNMANQFKQFFK